MLPISQPLDDGLGEAMRVLKIGQVLCIGDSGGGEVPTAAPRRPPRHRPPQHLIRMDEQRRALHGELKPTQRNHGGTKSVVPGDSPADVANAGRSHAQAQGFLALGAAEGSEGVEIHLPEVSGLSQQEARSANFSQAAQCCAQENPPKIPGACGDGAA